MTEASRGRRGRSHQQEYPSPAGVLDPAWPAGWSRWGSRGPGFVHIDHRRALTQDTACRKGQGRRPQQILLGLGGHHRDPEVPGYRSGARRAGVLPVCPGLPLTCAGMNRIFRAARVLVRSQRARRDHLRAHQCLGPPGGDPALNPGGKRMVPAYLPRPGAAPPSFLAGRCLPIRSTRSSEEGRGDARMMP
jgi:hypothetical protein